LSSGTSLLVALLGDRKLDTLALGERHLGLGTLTNDENVGKTERVSIFTHSMAADLPGSEGSVEDVSDVDNVESTRVPILVNDHTGSTHVTTTSDHANVSNLELDGVDNLVLGEVELDGVVDLDGRVRVSDGSAVVGDDVWDTLGTELVTTDLAELEGSLLGGNSVDGESTLDIVEESEVLARSLNGDDVWNISRCSLFTSGLQNSPMNPAG